MKITKIVSVLVVLTMISSSLVVIAAGEGAEISFGDSKANTNNGNAVTEISMTELVDAQNTYWINATADASNNITIKLATAGQKLPCVVSLINDAKYASASVKIDETDFTISDGCGIKASGNNIVATGDVTVNGILDNGTTSGEFRSDYKQLTVNITGVFKSYGVYDAHSITINGGEMYVGTNDINGKFDAKGIEKYDLFITVNSGYLSLLDDINGYANTVITINGGDVDVGYCIYGYGDLKLTINGGRTNIEKYIWLDGGDKLTLEINAGELIVNSDVGTGDDGVIDITVKGGYFYVADDIAGSESSTPYAQLKNKLTMNISGGYAYAYYLYSYGNGSAINVSGGTLQVDEWYPYGDLTVTIGGGSLIVDDECDMTAGTFTFNISGGSVSFSSYIEVKDESEVESAVILNYTGGTVYFMGFDIGEEEESRYMSINDAYVPPQSDGSFTMKMDKGSKDVYLSGTLYGFTDSAYLYLANGSRSNAVFDSLDLHSMYLDLYYDDGTITLKTDFNILNNDAYVNLSYSGLSGSRLVSAEGEHKFVAICTTDYDDYYFVNVYTCDTGGVKKSSTAVQVIATAGITKIDTGSQYGDYVLMDIGQAVNLDNYKVECRDGYVFDGWYYLDENGIEHKVLNTQSYAVSSGDILFAKAVLAPLSAPADYSVLLIAILVVMIVSIVLGALYVLRKEGIIGRKTV